MKYDMARAILSEAIERIEEQNAAPYGYHVKKSPSGRKRYIPKTKEDFDSERKKFFAKRPGGEGAYWAEINRRQKAANHANRGEIAEAIEQLDEKKLFDPVFGHAGIDRNPKARKFNPQTARPNKVRKREFEMRVGRAGYGLSNPESRSVNDGRHMLRDRINEASNLRRRMSRATHHMASLLRRAGATPEEVRQGMTLRRTPAAKSGRALLVKAMNDSRRKEAKNMPNYPYGRKGPTE